MSYIQIQYKEGLRTKTADAISLDENDLLVVVPEAGSQNFVKKTMNVQWNLWQKNEADQFYTLKPDSFQIEEIVSPENYNAFQALTGIEGMAQVEDFIRGFYQES